MADLKRRDQRRRLDGWLLDLVEVELHRLTQVHQRFLQRLTLAGDVQLEAPTYAWIGDKSGSVSDDEAKKTYPAGWKSPKPYIRIVPQPKG